MGDFRSPLDIISAISHKVRGVDPPSLSLVGVQGSALIGKHYIGKAYPYITWYYHKPASDVTENLARFNLLGDIKVPQQERLYKGLKVSPLKMLPTLEQLENDRTLQQGPLKGITPAVFLSGQVEITYEKDAGLGLIIKFLSGSPDIMSKIYLLRESEVNSPPFTGKPGLASMYPNDSIRDSVIPSDLSNYYLLVYQGLPNMKGLDKTRPTRPYAMFTDVGESYPWRYRLELYYFPTAISTLAPDKSPIPGELFALACEPFSNRGFAWYYQDSYPFIYSATWFETKFFTSGVIEDIIDPSTGKSVSDKDPVTNCVYAVRCKEYLWTGNRKAFYDDLGVDFDNLLKLLSLDKDSLPEPPKLPNDPEKEAPEEFYYVVPTDYKLYKKGDRVALLKSTKNELPVGKVDVSYVKIPSLGKMLFRTGFKHMNKPYFRIVPYDFYERLKTFSKQ